MIETKAEQFKALALAVIDTELDAVSALKDRIDDDFVKACQLLLDCEGRIVVICM